jgi:hypothetical protein
MGVEAAGVVSVVRLDSTDGAAGIEALTRTAAAHDIRMVKPSRGGPVELTDAEVMSLVRAV